MYKVILLLSFLLGLLTTLCQAGKYPDNYPKWPEWRDKIKVYVQPFWDRDCNKTINIADKGQRDHLNGKKFNSIIFYENRCRHFGGRTAPSFLRPLPQNESYFTPEGIKILRADWGPFINRTLQREVADVEGPRQACTLVIFDKPHCWGNAYAMGPLEETAMQLWYGRLQVSNGYRARGFTTDRENMLNGGGGQCQAVPRGLSQIASGMVVCEPQGPSLKGFIPHGGDKCDLPWCHRLIPIRNPMRNKDSFDRTNMNTIREMINIGRFRDNDGQLPWYCDEYACYPREEFNPRWFIDPKTGRFALKCNVFGCLNREF